MINSVDKLVLAGKWTKIGLLVAIIAVLVPFWVLALFNHPSGDNFCYSEVFDEHGLIGGIKSWYRRWNGRYFSLFLMGSYFSPFEMIATYRYVPFALFSAWLLAAYYLLKTIVGASSRTLSVAGCAVGLCALYTVTMPLVSNGFYHVTGAFQYQTGNILTLAALGTMARIGLKSTPYGYTLASALLVFAVVGSTELHMALMVILVPAVTLYVFSTRNHNRYAWAFLLLVTIFSAALLILAPGNETRGQHFEGRHQLWFSIIESANHLWSWSWQWIREPLLWFSLSVYAFWLAGFSRQSEFCQKVGARHIAIVLPCWGLSLFACFFISFWAMGVDLPGRALNVVYFIFLLGWFALVTFGISALRHLEAVRPSIISMSGPTKAMGIIATLVMIAGLLTNESFHIAYSDLTERARDYDELFQARYRQIASAAKVDLPVVEVPEVDHHKRPGTIMVDDIRSDRYNFRNQCFADYFGIPAIATVKEERFWVTTPPIQFETEKGSELSEYAPYVLFYEDLKEAWVGSNEDIEQWGKSHWTHHGQKEGRSLGPDMRTGTPRLTLRRHFGSTEGQINCSAKSTHSDESSELVFTLDINIPNDAVALKAISHIKLDRIKLTGSNETTGQNNLLGISLNEGGPLIDNRNGRLHLRNLAKIKRLWLFSCADGNERPDSLYQAKVQFNQVIP